MSAADGKIDGRIGGKVCFEGWGGKARVNRHSQL